MTKKIKLIINMIIFVIMVLLMQYNVYASKDTGAWKDVNIMTNTNSNSTNYEGTSDTIEGMEPDSWKPSSTTVTSGTNKIQEIGNSIIGPIRIIGTIVSVVTLIIIGIKYILGSVEEKAEYKKTMTPYLIGAVMVFATTNLLGILINIIGGF